MTETAQLLALICCWLLAIVAFFSYLIGRMPVDDAIVVMVMAAVSMIGLQA